MNWYIVQILVLISSISYAQVTQMPGLYLPEIVKQAVLELPYHASSKYVGMGKTGVAFADDNALIPYNPAGLGLENSKWKTGALNYSYTRLTTDFKDIYQAHIGLCYQPAVLPGCGFGLAFSDFHFGEFEVYALDGSLYYTNRYDIQKIILSYGMNFGRWNGKSLNIGLSAKYTGSNTRYDYGYDISTLHFDAGVIYNPESPFRFAVTARNLGKTLYGPQYVINDYWTGTGAYYARYKSVTTTEKNVLIIPAITCAAGYEFKYNLPALQLVNGEYEMNINQDIQDIGNTSLRIGFELILLNTFVTRHGAEIDFSTGTGQYYSGGGLQLFNHIQFDFFRIPESDGQVPRGNISIQLNNMFSWSKADLTWFRTKTK